MGPSSKKPRVEHDARPEGGRRPRRPPRQASTLELMEWLLTRRVSISMSGHAKQVSATEAIVLQLMQKAMSGNARACRALFKYQEFANSRSDKSKELRFVESNYTRAVANSSSRSDDA
jgi:Family of unknown function (DUF5681)